MKTKSLLTLLAASALLFASCRPDVPEDDGNGKVVPEYIPGSLVAEDNRTSVTLREGTDETKDLCIYYLADKELEEGRAITVAVDASATTLPEANYEYSGTLEVAAGEDRSSLSALTFKASGLQAGDYTLVLAEVAEDETKASEPLEFRVTVRTPQTGNYGFMPDNVTVCYVNTNDYQPLLADAYVLEVGPRRGDKNYYYLANVVNLRTVVLKDNNGRAELVLGRDMEHVLANRAKYIVPLQDKGHKVCLVLEGGATGLGFCNLTDAQIDDFVAQVRKVVYDNDLDGVNFFDKGAAYEQAESNGLPAMNTTSYPKLIQKMRTALPGKLVTLADYGEPTAYFYDTEATGGIKVGEHIDYAWSGYMDVSESPQILDPWGLVDPNDPKVKEAEALAFDIPAVFPFAKDERKPIAGLTPDRYGNFACPYYSYDQHFLYEADELNLFTFSYCGWWKSRIFVIGEMISNIQNEYEGAWSAILSYYDYAFLSSVMGVGTDGYNINFNVDEYGFETFNQYDFFAKDWE